MTDTSLGRHAMAADRGPVLMSTPQTVFIRLIGVEEKASALLRAKSSKSGEALRYEFNAAELRSIPTTPFAYWLPPGVRALFAELAPTSDIVDTRRGMASLDDFRFVRCTWEIDRTSNGWVPYSKGEGSRKYLESAYNVVRWGRDGREVKAHVEQKVGSASRTIQAESYYFREGATWVRRTERLSVRFMPPGFIFSGGAQAAFPADGSRQLLSAFVGFANSAAFDALLKVGAGRTGDAVQFEPGMIARTPWPPKFDGRRLAELSQAAWACHARLDSVSEASHLYVLPALLRVQGASLEVRLTRWAASFAATRAELVQLQSEVDELALGLYGLSVDDRLAITSGLDDLGDSPKGEDPVSVEEEIEVNSLAAGLVAWCFGVGMGRFDLRLATGGRGLPVARGPFNPLPVCSPGMLAGEDGLPLDASPAGYPIEVSPLLVDDPGHRFDVAAQARSVFEVVFGDDADEWWSDVGEALGAKGLEVGSWLSKGFFDHHLKTYSKSRRKAPIYWPLGTSSGSYVVWLYAHRVTGDSVFQVLNDVVSPKLVLERRRLSELTQETGPNPSATERKAIYSQEKLVGELQEFMDELSAVAPLWHPALNDGIVVVLAPLWRLFAHHKPWAKELRKHWDSLVVGEYDWAQLAMHLWPERVVPKCAEDRGLAIAHGLEGVFWIQEDGNPDKWHPRQTPTVAVEQLIADRTKPATKAALQEAIR